MFKGYIIRDIVTKDSLSFGIISIRVAIDWETNEMVFRSARFHDASPVLIGDRRTSDFTMMIPKEEEYAIYMSKMRRKEAGSEEEPS
jgi:hypothetical protein